MKFTNSLRTSLCITVGALLLTLSSFAQAPGKMSYQAVIRDASNALVTNQQVGMQISILQGATAVYEEIQTPTSNTNGLVSLEIGAGTIVSGIFSSIDWSAGTYFIKTETDPTRGTNYTITGTSQLLSVPYALYANTSSDTEAVAANTAKVGYTEALVSANTDVAANTAKIGYTEAAVSANTDVATNTAKVGYTEAAVSANTDVAANTAKVGYTEAAVSANTDVAANTAKIGYTEAAVSANTDVAANTAKVGYTEAAVSANTDVAANTAKIGYTEALVSANTDVAANTAKVGYTEAVVSANTDVEANTAKVGYTEAAVSANTDVAANTAKVGYTEALVSANTDVAANTAKIGYTEAAVSANTDVAANTAKVGYTEAAVSANTDVAANTAKVGYTEAAVSANTDVAANTAKVGYTEALVSANTDVAANTAKVGYTEAAVSANTDVAANTLKVGLITHAVGDSYGGGIVFFVYDGGQHGLIAATEDQSTGIRWHGGSDTNTRARADGIGAGLKNTAIIIANQGSVDGDAFAATFCNEYSVTADGVTYGDWYLPSKYELNLLYLQKDVVGSFPGRYYWSSTEYDANNAWRRDFYYGSQPNDYKSSTNGSVRAVRAF